jgi:tetratricopeptide (TPR) repeat protein
MRTHQTLILATLALVPVLTSGCPWKRAQEEKLRAAEARAEAERFRAEVEKRRADQAEQRMVMAQDRAAAAEAFLEKGRRLSALLRAADRELGDIVTVLERSFFSDRTIEEKRALWEAHEQEVDAFGKTVAGDTASQAAWLAVKGWLKYLGGFEAQALELFQQSRGADPDVAHGALFETLVLYSKWLVLHPLPMVDLTREMVRLGRWPEETEAMGALRKRIEPLLEKAASCAAWGESAAREFHDVIEGLRAALAGDPEIAEGGLSRALAVPEFRWFRNLFLRARAIVRVRNKNYSGAVEDLRGIIEELPGTEGVRAWLNQVEGVVKKVKEGK